MTLKAHVWFFAGVWIAVELCLADNVVSEHFPSRVRWISFVLFVLIAILGMAWRRRARRCKETAIEHAQLRKNVAQYQQESER